jgi:hypothetical protein
MIVALTVLDSWLIVIGAIAAFLCVARVIFHAVGAGFELAGAWRGLDVQPAAEEAGELREERSD